MRQDEFVNAFPRTPRPSGRPPATQPVPQDQRHTRKSTPSSRAQIVIGAWNMKIPRIVRPFNFAASWRLPVVVAVMT
jgi:hypothetical protein